jgi:pimeloyl-ACP methyl ester carboxylesterase
MQPQVPHRLVLLPGLGADSRLFDLQRAEFPDIVVPPWLEPEPGEELPAYAARLAQTVREPDDAYVLGGASFGGMLALEMARLLRPGAVVLIGSAFSGREVCRWLRWLECVGHPLPTGAINAGRTLTPMVAPIFSSASRCDLDLFLDMLNQTPTRFLRWAGRAIMRWTFQGELACPVHRIHGAADFVIQPPRANGVRLVNGAGHVLSMTHPEETNAFLRDATRTVRSAAANRA